MVLSSLRTLGLETLPRHRQRRRRHDRSDGRGRRRSAQKFTTIYSGMEVEPFLQSAEHREPRAP